MVIRGRQYSYYFAQSFGRARSKHQRILLAFQDVAEQKRAEAQLRVAQKELIAHAEEVGQLNIAAVNRERRVAELKKQVNERYQQLGQPAPYPLAEPMERKV